MASDPVIEAYKKGIDRTLLRENLKLTPEQRLLKAMDLKRCGLLMALRAAKVDLIVVGGVAAAVHGSARFTSDLDIVYSRDPGNVARLARALAPRQPYPRGAAPGLPFLWDDRTIRAGLNFTLSTGLGENLGLFGEIGGGGAYPDLLPHTIEVTFFGKSACVLDLPMLIRTKRAAGQPRDVEAVAELEALEEERGA